MSLLLVVRFLEEGSGLLSRAVRLAEGLETDLEVLICDPEAGGEIFWEEGEKPEFLGDQDVRWGRVALTKALSSLAEYLTEAPIDLVLVGKHNSEKGEKDSAERRLSKAVFEKIRCGVMVLRLPEENVIPGKILVPCAGGAHSRLALSYASKMGETTAFLVEPGFDEVSEEVGERFLRKAMQKAKVEGVETKVALGTKVDEEIRKEAESGEYELILLGAGSAKKLRSKLFGTVPDRLMRGPGALAIGVVRAPLPKGALMRAAVGRVMRLTVPQLEREERVQLVDEVESKAQWTFDFATLMILATTIAALGLLANSVAVVIGAMLVAPLMTPLIGGGLALVQGNWPLWSQSARAVLLGFFSALLVGVGLGLCARFFGFGITSELAARGEPTLLDLGVAFFSGIAASYCLARPHLSGALAGVAIAAALVPPIATVGISLALGATEIARGAALLFGTNVVAIVLGAALNFYMAGIRGQRKDGRGRLWSQRLFIGLALVCAGLVIPLTSVLLGKVTEPRRLQVSLVEVAAEEGYRLVKLRKMREDGGRLIEIELAGESAPPNSLVQEMKEAASEITGKEVTLRVRTLLETTSE